MQFFMLSVANGARQAHKETKQLTTTKTVMIGS